MTISYRTFAFRFTLILSSKHAQQKQQPKSMQVRRRSGRSSTGSSDSVSCSTNTQLFPKHCFICQKDHIQHNIKDEYPHLIKTKIGEVSIKLVAKEKIPSFYHENKNEDLIVRELKCHRLCYNKFRLSSVRFDDISNNSESREYQEEGNYNSVTNYVTKHILNEKKTVLIAALHTIYGLKPNDARCRSKLKSRLKKYFPTLSFLNIGRNSPDIVIDGSAEFDEITFNDKEGYLIKAAEYLRNDIIKQCESASELAWLPDIDKLKIYSKPCDFLMLFYKNLLSPKDNKHRLSEFCDRAPYSFASDLMAAATRGKMVTTKQYLLALGIRNITGQRKTVNILNRLGHCLTYNHTCEIETALAEKPEQLSLKD